MRWFERPGEGFRANRHDVSVRAKTFHHVDVLNHLAMAASSSSTPDCERCSSNMGGHRTIKEWIQLSEDICLLQTSFAMNSSKDFLRSVQRVKKNAEASRYATATMGWLTASWWRFPREPIKRGEGMGNRWTQQYQDTQHEAFLAQRCLWLRMYKERAVYAAEL